MILSCKVLSLAEFKDLPSLGRGHIVISIVNPDSDSPIQCGKKFLPMKFDDCHPSSAFKFPQHNMKAMSFEEADKMFKFIEFWNGQHEEVNLIVHCHAGICRSGAVGEFVKFYCDLDSNEFHKMNPNIQPNDWVLNSLFQVAMENKND